MEIDIVLQHQFTDSDGRGVYHIYEAPWSSGIDLGDSSPLGLMRVKLYDNKDAPYRWEWAEGVCDDLPE